MEESKLIKKLVRVAALKIIDHLKSKKISVRNVSDKPYPMTNWTGRASTNLTGKKMGQLTIIGYIGNEKGSIAEGRWQAVCECGRFQKIHRYSNTKEMKSISNIKCSMCVFQERIEDSIKFAIEEIENDGKLEELIEEIND